MARVLKKFPAESLFDFAANLSGNIRILSLPRGENDTLDAAWKELVRSIVVEADGIAGFIERPAIRLQTRRILALVDDEATTFTDIKHALEHLEERLVDELSLCEFVHLEDLTSISNRSYSEAELQRYCRKPNLILKKRVFAFA